MPRKTKTVTKSAITGRFVTNKHAKRSPRTTYKQTVPTKRGGKK